MQKNLNDIIPPSRRRAQEGSDSTPSYPSSSVPPERPSYARPTAPRRKRSFPMKTAIAALVVVLISVGALFLFSGAEVTVTATENQTTVTGEFIATSAGSDLTFEVLTVEKIATVSKPSEGTETVDQAAQGTIIIENTQDVAQQLIKNTRFETPDGKIYRIRDSVTVPAGRTGAPGTLETTVYADATGESYNVGPTTFTLPGLAGGSTFTQVTARSTEAMRGGFSGTRPSVSQATRDSAATALRAELSAGIETELAASIPEGYVLVPGASRVAYEPQPDVAGSGGNVTISERAVVTAVVFPANELARSIAFQVVGVYGGQPVTLKSAAGLTLTPVGDIPTPGTTEFAFSLSGNTSILWLVDNERIAAAVAGKTRESAQTILSGFPEVERAALILRPFWNSSFPADPAKITVTVENDPKTP